MQGICNGCGEIRTYKVIARKLCGTCYNHYLSNPLNPRNNITKYDNKFCDVETCDNLRKRGRYCVGHAERMKKYGHPDVGRPLRKRSKRIKRQGRNGTLYWYLYKPEHPLARKDGYIAEHRLIAYENGWFTDPDREEVHHRDHDGLNNNPDNLKVLTTKQHRQEHVKEDGVTNQFGRFYAHTDVCTIDGCERPGASEKYCEAHYARYQRYGNPLAVKKANKSTIKPFEIIEVSS